MLKVGVSSCFFHADPKRAVFKGKTLLYLVEDVGHWLLRRDALPCMISTLPAMGAIKMADVVRDLDGLVLQGGSDVAPETYGEKPIKPEWSGDAIRDQYEIALVKEFRSQGKPVFGICRGLQLLNVAFGGTLYQDITTQVTGSLQHRNWDVYERNFHQVEISPGSRLAEIYSKGGHNNGIASAKINSVHHQAIKDLGKGFKAEAFSIPDRLIEAIRFEGDEYVVGVQWHPEFQASEDNDLLPTEPLLDEFVNEIKKRKKV